MGIKADLGRAGVDSLSFSSLNGSWEMGMDSPGVDKLNIYPFFIISLGERFKG